MLNKKNYNYQLDYRRKKLFNTKEWYRRKRLAVLSLLGNKCVMCGIDDFRVLQIDHIQGGGYKDKKSRTEAYWTTVINSVLKKENKYQLLCANCNWIKRFENNEVRKK